MSDGQDANSEADGEAALRSNPERPLSPAARRALEEAAARRADADRAGDARPAEVNGPKGAEPTRYGDWERKGLTSDF
ncbi:MAG: succinate dehydrogenase assembly factor 4 [Pseudomonadota bacterium]